MYVVRLRWPREQLSSMGWLQPVLDAQVASTFIPPIYEGLGRYRVATRPELDVRNVPQPSFAWASYVTEQIVTNTILPTVPEAYRVREGVALDVRSIPEPSFAWVWNVVEAQVASALYPPVAAVSRFRVREGEALDVRNIPQPPFSWVAQPATDDVAAKFIPPIYEALQRFVVPQQPEIDVRNIPQPSQAWLPSVVFDTLQYQWAPIEETLHSFRVREGEQLDVRNVPQPEPIYHQSQVLPPQWAPIAAELQSFRVPEGEVLDVRNIPQPFFNYAAETPVIRTTQILAEIVLRPHAPTGTIEQPPPILFNTDNILVRLTGPAQAMEICSGYVGQPPVLSQLQQVRAHYTTFLAPRTSALHPVHTPQIGRTEIQGVPGVLSVKNSWFNMRQTDRYHRVCLNCTGDTEITGLTWMLREAGIR